MRPVLPALVYLLGDSVTGIGAANALLHIAFHDSGVPTDWNTTVLNPEQKHILAAISEEETLWNKDLSMEANRQYLFKQYGIPDARASLQALAGE